MPDLIIPVRLRLSRKKNFNLQALSQETNGLPGYVVSRPSEFGNPYWVGRNKNDTATPWCVEIALTTDWSVWRYETEKEARAEAVRLFETWLASPKQEKLRARAMLALKRCNLACWCKAEDPCHADVLLKLVNP